MNTTFAIALKEWTEFRRDRLALALAFLLPLATLLLFGYGVRLQAKNIPLTIRDSDNSKVSKKIVQGFQDSNMFCRRTDSSSEPSSCLLQQNKVKAAIEIPSGFEDDMVMEQKPKLKTIIDGSDISSARTVEAASHQVHLAIEKAAAKENGDDTLFVTPNFHFLFNPDLKESLFIVPGVFGIVLWMYPALLIAVAAAREFEYGTLIQLQSAKVLPLELLTGKALVYFAIGALEMIVVGITAALLFNIHFIGDPLPFIVGSALYILSAVLFGIVIGTFTRAQTVAVQTTATGGFFPSLLLSGFVYPISNIPAPLNLVCALVPATYYISVCRDAFVRGSGWSATWIPNCVLLAFTTGLFLLALSGSKRLQEQR